MAHRLTNACSRRSVLGLNSIDHIAAAALAIVGVLYPLADAKRFRSKLKSLGDSPSPARIIIYWELLAWLWATSALVIFYWLFQDYSFSYLGFSVPNTLRFWSALGVVGILVVFMVFMSVGLMRSNDLREKVIANMAKMDEAPLLPRNRRELQLWGVCSLSASSEEIVFRGFFFWYLLSQFGTWTAAVGSTILFAIAHIYQGPGGVLRSGIYGAVLMVVYLVAGSIWPPIILHFSQDLYSGVAGYLSWRYPKRVAGTV